MVKEISSISLNCCCWKSRNTAAVPIAYPWCNVIRVVWHKWKCRHLFTSSVLDLANLKNKWNNICCLQFYSHYVFCFLFCFFLLTCPGELELLNSLKLHYLTQQTEWLIDELKKWHLEMKTSHINGMLFFSVTFLKHQSDFLSNKK